MDRPLGVTLLASFFAMESVINAIALYGYYAGGFPLGVTLYYTIVSMAGFAAAYGLYVGQSWGRYGTMVLSGWEILIGLLGTYMALEIEPMSPVQAMTKVLVNAIVIYFLTRPEIVGYFKR
ncbi:MAG: hypothetical protein Q8O47_05485 [Candidatus Bathyarchaeota archaeon]|nr:hypothetical protein [Candidatus Bathyarchaeota archaeon]